MQNTKSFFIKALVSVITCQLVGVVGALFTASSVKTWFPTLEKPFFNPPSWIFGPVWTTLYLLMGIAAALVWHEDLCRREVKTALKVFVAQLFLNFLWSILFFGLQSPLLGLLDIVPLFFLIVLTIKYFYLIHKTAAWLLIPYVLWVGFASILNFAIWWLN